jgi:hypothetical protein
MVAVAMGPHGRPASVHFDDGTAPLPSFRGMIMGWPYLKSPGSMFDAQYWVTAPNSYVLNLETPNTPRCSMLAVC